MRRHLLDIAVLFVTGSLVAGYLVASQPSLRNIVLHAYVFLVGGLVMLGLVAAAGDAVPRRKRSIFEQALAHDRPQVSPVADLERMERQVTLAASSAYDLHVRLLPHLREIAQCRLERSGHTSSLGRWWDLLRPDRPAPDDRFAPGISQSELRALVSDLEKMGA